MRLRTLAWAIASAWIGTSAATADPIKVGDKAPEFKVGKWYNAPKKVTLAGLKGKVVIIDFWATW